MNDILKVIKSRRSTRAFKSEQIKKEELDMILESAMYAPSGHNTQPWHFTVIQNREVISHINSISKQVMATSPIEWIKNAGSKPEYDITYNAPTLIIISGRTDAITWRTDCDAAIQNMLIAAESLNVGSCWLGFATFGFKIEGEAEKIGIPKGYEPFYGVVLGYKSKADNTAPARNMNVVNYIQ